jgi:hypothetical protein
MGDWITKSGAIGSLCRGNSTLPKLNASVPLIQFKMDFNVVRSFDLPFKRVSYNGRGISCLFCHEKFGSLDLHFQNVRSKELPA